MKQIKEPKATVTFILIATTLMILIHLAVTEKRGPYVHPDEGSRDKTFYSHSEIADFELAAPAPLKIPEREVAGPPEPFGPPVPIFREMAGPFMPKPAVYAGQKAKIVIIIDDLGMDRRRTRAIMDLPGALTLAFLPYAPGLTAITAEAKEKGHELMIHVPMEPLDSQLDPGPLALVDNMEEAEFDLVLDKIFESFEGYAGINNHMGSKLTQDKTAMRKIMAALAKRHLYFIDSKTIASSVADKEAARAGIKHGARDVFLDNEDSLLSVNRALHELESLARKRGFAIAIGHPRDATIQGLRNWIPGLASRGFELVPASAVITEETHKIPVLKTAAPAPPPQR